MASGGKGAIIIIKGDGSGVNFDSIASDSKGGGDGIATSGGSIDELLDSEIMLTAAAAAYRFSAAY
jgi:hypothetical protein